MEEEMPHKTTSLRPGFGRLLALAALIGLLILPLGTALRAEDAGGTKGEAGADRALRLKTLVPVPVSNVNTTAGAMYSFDISYVDQATQTYYLADRPNKAVEVVDARTGQFLTQIFANFKGFTPCPAGLTPTPGANDCAGPNCGVAALPWLFV